MTVPRPNSFGVEVDRDDDAGAERTRRRNGNRVDERAVHQPAAGDLHRAENAGQGVARAHRFGEASLREPDFVAGTSFGRDRRESARASLRSRVGPMIFEKEVRAEPPAISPAPPKRKSMRPRMRRLLMQRDPFLKLVEFVRGPNSRRPARPSTCRR